MNESMQADSGITDHQTVGTRVAEEPNRGFRPSIVRKSLVIPWTHKKGYSFTRNTVHVIEPRLDIGDEADSIANELHRARPRSASQLKWVSVARAVRTCSTLGLLDHPPPRFRVVGSRYEYPRWDLCYTVPNLHQRAQLSKLDACIRFPHVFLRSF